MNNEEEREERPTGFNPHLVDSEKVTELFEKASKWDITLKGKTVRLKLMPCMCGVRALFVYDIPVEVRIPKALQRMMPDMDNMETMEHIYSEFHFHPKWWQRYIMRQTLEGEMLKWLRHVHATLSDLKKSEENLEGLLEKMDALK